MRKLLYIGCLVLAACGGAKEGEKEAAKATEKAPNTSVALNEVQRKNLNVSVGKPTTRELRRILRVRGRVEAPPQNLVFVHAPLGGYVRETKLLSGMSFRKGEVIATLEDPQYVQIQEEYLVTKLQLSAAEAELARQKALNETKAGSDKNLLQASTEQQTQRIRLRALGEKLRILQIDPDKLTEENISKNIQLRAPFSGFVSKVNINVGKYVTPTEVLFELVNPDDVHLTLKVFEKDLPFLAVGQRLSAHTNAQPEQIHGGEILLISRDFYPDGTVDVHCHFDKYDPRLQQGIFMNVDIELKHSSAIALPASALVQEGENWFVFASEDSTNFRLLPVQLGISDGDWREVLAPTTLATQPLALQGAYALWMTLKKDSEEEE